MLELLFNASIGTVAGFIKPSVPFHETVREAKVFSRDNGRLCKTLGGAPQGIQMKGRYFYMGEEVEVISEDWNKETGVLKLSLKRM